MVLNDVGSFFCMYLCCRSLPFHITLVFILDVLGLSASWKVLESVFQQDRVQVGSVDNLGKNNLVGKGQVTAMTALKELRKISNLLSEIEVRLVVGFAKPVTCNPYRIILFSFTLVWLQLKLSYTNGMEWFRDRRPAFDGDGWLRASDGMVELSEVEDVCSLIR
ncbi:hypothetical protein Golax_024020 [Gossypium laxum]|uniref:Uncharacterized protein n=1 Tax=Gossypium laxum TaxID=34288 RepID=A0A7J8ZBJ6_9ROSI|nr:hypothetical protein [Gossypium laxum]